jgi:hypothetical protein
MKKAIVLIFCLFLFVPAFSQYTVSGGKGQPFLAEENSTMKVYLLNELSAAEISYTSADSETHQWYRYNTKAGEAEAIPCRQTGNTSTITDIDDGFGYFVGLPNSSATSYIWIIDYSKYIPVFSSLFYQEEDDKCKSLKLLADVDAKPLRYISATGARIDLQRTYHLLYNN